MKTTLTVITAMGILMLFSCSGKRPSNLGLKDGKLAPCPDSPNCVSSYATDKEHGIRGIAFSGSVDDAMKKLKALIQKLPRTKIVTEKKDYLYVEFTSFLFRFVDDVEFFIDDTSKMIQVRSASRVGHSDLGVNRKRIEKIREMFRKN